MRIFNSHGNTTCFVLMVIVYSRFSLDFIMRILFDYEYDKYLGAFRFVLVSRNNRRIKPLFVYTKANYGSYLRAAARYHHANEGVSVK